jgi:hypothetical protein
VPYASFGDPQTLNLYSYVENAPLNKVDADGHDPLSNASFAGNSFEHYYYGVAGQSGECAEINGCGEEETAQRQTEEKSDAVAYVERVQDGAAQQQSLSSSAEQAILNSNLNGVQATAFEAAVISAGNKYGVDPNVLVGMAGQESTFNPAAQSSTSSANGLFGLTSGVRTQYGLSSGDATGTSASAITNQVTTAAHYLSDLKNGPVPKSHPEHSLEIAIGYYRGSRKGVNAAMSSKDGYNAMLKLTYGGETLGHYINSVERYVP